MTVQDATGMPGHPAVDAPEDGAPDPGTTGGGGGLPSAATLLDALPVPALVVDRAGSTVAANRRLADLVGRHPLPTGSSARFLSTQAGWQRVWRYANEGPTAEPCVAVLEDPDGTRHHVEVRVGHAPDAGHRLLTLLDLGPIRAARREVVSRDRLLAVARAELEAARRELGRAGDQVAQLLAELEACGGGVAGATAPGPSRPSGPATTRSAARPSPG